tara:strand:- start:1290 stop:1889 length:600 start_codon:yes stop_codon:yes gene_type:complete
MVLNKFRKKKLIQFSLLLVGIFLILLIYFSNTIKESVISQDIKSKDNVENNLEGITIFENLEYRGEDKSGNKFVIFSDYSDFEENLPEIIRMRGILCYFYFKDGTILEVRSKKGVYNNVSLDISFSKNVSMFYMDNSLFSDKADYKNEENRLYVEGNVRSEGPKGNFTSDKLNFDFTDKTVKVSMHQENERVNVKTNLK